MTNPKCVLCGEEFNHTRCASDNEHKITHSCGIDSVDSEFDYSLNFHSGWHRTKAAALAAIPERFLMKGV